ncbi:MAG TPA: DUF58 domain-containing protein, partial [Alistipes sp.]|nr:DUF58 domain-containing protein [Alistipes sp.]
RRRSDEIEGLLRRHRIDTATVDTQEDYVAELIKLFKQR